MIKINNITKSFQAGFIPKTIEVLKGISLEVGKNEVFGFLGPNGAGKTTTIKILMDLIRADSGSASISGYAVTDLRARYSVGFLPEQPYFYSYLTGKELLQLSGKLCGMNSDTIETRSEELLTKTGMDEHKEKRLKTYSRGMLQRIGVAQALINDPELLILDEPLSGLDPVGRRDVQNIIFEEKKKGKTIFFSSHILSDAQSICDRVGILNKGTVISTGKLSEVLEGDESHREVEIEFRNGTGSDIDTLESFGSLVILSEGLSRLSLNRESDLNVVIELLMNNGAEIESVNRKKMSLEQFFLETTEMK